MPSTKKKKDIAPTPLMKQYQSIKAKHPDALLLFRVGDFYETFGEDAVKASAILGIVLTRRSNGAASEVELAGFPHHSLDTYLPKLVRAGQRVAICDQLEDPKLTKTIVKRGVTELVTPGVAMNDEVLDHKSNNFLAALHFGGDNTGIAFLDISTGEFLLSQGSMDYVDKLMQSFRPSEVVYLKSCRKQFAEKFGEDYHTFRLDEWVFTPEYAMDTLLGHFGTASLKGFGVEKLTGGIIAAGACLHYVAETQHDKIRHVASVARIDEERYVWLDRFTIRNLELFASPNPDAVTFLDIMDDTVSPMGARMLRKWIALPLRDISPIEERLGIVETLVSNSELCDALRSHLARMGDIERLVSKVAAARITPRELVQLRKALDAVGPVKEACAASGSKALQHLAGELNTCDFLREKIGSGLLPDAPALVNRGRVMAEGVSAELDELRRIAYSGKDYLREIQRREAERTGIPSLKVSFNNVFGYYLEVTNAHKSKVPDDWIRKQTLVSAERYITEELKEYEQKILGAEEKILALETRLFNELVTLLSGHIRPVQLNAVLLARLDCLLSFAVAAVKHNYRRPEVNNSTVLDIKGGRHPVIERQLPAGQGYIANDVYLDTDNQQIIIITGPNMSGKSALLRQTALIVLLAQMGSFVPATQARIGVADKLFTRVGASDNISSGESTFLVEMNETASIINNLTGRSLLLLDEIGRGTSTYDGISIAWSIAEYLHEHRGARARTLFATHYHELNDLAASFPRIKNYNIAVKEAGNNVIFLRKLVPGGSEHSFGIHVARMAGMPKAIVHRATELLKQLETAHSRKPAKDGGKTQQKAAEGDLQLSFFRLDDPVLEQIRDELISIDVNSLTPVEALMKLNEVRKLIGGK